MAGRHAYPGAYRIPCCSGSVKPKPVVLIVRACASETLHPRRLRCRQRLSDALESCGKFAGFGWKPPISVGRTYWVPGGSPFYTFALPSQKKRPTPAHRRRTLSCRALRAWASAKARLLFAQIGRTAPAADFKSGALHRKPSRELPSKAIRDPPSTPPKISTLRCCNSKIFNPNKACLFRSFCCWEGNNQSAVGQRNDAHDQGTYRSPCRDDCDDQYHALLINHARGHTLQCG